MMQRLPTGSDSGSAAQGDQLDQIRILPDRRQHPRVPAEGVEIELLIDDELVTCCAQDLSLGGARVRSQRVFHGGDTALVVIATEALLVITLGIVLASMTLVEQGTVETRVQFHNLSPIRREQLSRVLNGISA